MHVVNFLFHAFVDPVARSIKSRAREYDLDFSFGEILYIRFVSILNILLHSAIYIASIM